MPPGACTLGLTQLAWEGRTGFWHQHPWSRGLGSPRAGLFSAAFLILNKLGLVLCLPHPPVSC